jgi:hypothetical protein
MFDILSGMSFNLLLKYKFLCRSIRINNAMRSVYIVVNIYHEFIYFYKFCIFMPNSNYIFAGKNVLFY